MHNNYASPLKFLLQVVAAASRSVSLSSDNKQDYKQHSKQVALMAASSQPAPTTLQPPNVGQIARQTTTSSSTAEQQQLLQHTASAPAQYLLTTAATATTNNEYPLQQHNHQPSNQISSSRLAAFQPANAEVALTSGVPSNSFARYGLSQTPLVQLELDLANQQEQQQPAAAQYAVEGQLLTFAGQHQQDHLVQQQVVQQQQQQQHYIPATTVVAPAPAYLTVAGKGHESNIIQPQQIPRNKPVETNTNQLSGPTQQIILVAHNANQLNG